MKITIFPKVVIPVKDKQLAARNTVKGEVLELSSKNDFFDAVTSRAWSASIFKEGYRKLSNFISCSFLPFDIDDNISLRDAITKIELLGYTCIVGTSMNHQKSKDGITTDRFRLIFPLSEAITSPEVYRATWKYLEESFLIGVDTSCKDPSRFFFPCSQVSFIKGFRKVQPMKPPVKVAKDKKKYDGVNKGQISKRTADFIENGSPVGNRHHEFILALLDLKAQGYSMEEAKAITIPVMEAIKPEEDANFQVEHIFKVYDVNFEYRDKKDLTYQKK